MDKDTFIAQEIFPKNLDAGKVRRPRLNVKSVSVDTSSRKTRLTLCILGSWAIYMPPYNIARLSALTREAGYYTRVFDFNVESHYDLKDANENLSDAWNGANYFWWQNPEYYSRIHPTYEPILKTYIDQILEEESDIIGFSTYYTNILPTKWVINEIKKRKPNVTIILGGPECHEGYFKKPDNVDYYFVGESEQNILDFLNNWENGIKPKTENIGSLYSDTRIDIDSLPYPDYSDFDLTKYWGKNSICAEISRGCVAKCTYCTEVYYWKFRDRGAHTVVDEIEYQVKKYDIRFIQFVDSLMNGNLKEFRKFCQEIVDRKLNIQWWGYARADGRMDLNLYQLMADAGAQGFNYGFESGSDKVLKAINKKNTVAEINQNIIDSHAVGMKVSACWVIGAPGEDIEAFNHSFNLLWNHRTRIYAVSPGPGLGDNFGSAYDDREKFDINPRNKPWLGGWYTNDLTNTKLHRFIRIKLMHIWLHLCREFNGTLQNVHKIGNITDHFTVNFSNDLIAEEIEYETFDFNIIQSPLGDFANSVMNEVFNLLRILYRVKGGYEITINFNEDLDHKDFIFAIVPNTMEYTAKINFKIDDNGNYVVDSYYKFVNKFKNVIKTDGFTHHYTSQGQWTDGKKVRPKKTIFIKQEQQIEKSVLTFNGCFSGLGIKDRLLLHKLVSRLPSNSKVLESYGDMGGRASIFSSSPNVDKVFTFINFKDYNFNQEFNNLQSWLPYQISDICREQGLDNSVGESFLDDLKLTLKNNITSSSLVEKIIKHTEKVSINHTVNESYNVLFLNTYYSSYIKKEYISNLEVGGFFIVYPVINFEELMNQFSINHEHYSKIASEESIEIYKKLL